MLRLALLVAAALVAVSFVPPAPGATACANRILHDWSEDGQVASKYSLPCYEEAIDALPSDLRDYTNAEDVITRALTSAVRANGSGGGPNGSALAATGVEQADGSPPFALVAVGIAALVLLSAGGAAYVARRLRDSDDLGDRPA